MIQVTTNKNKKNEGDKNLGKLQRPHYDLTGIIGSKGNHPKMALIQVSEKL
jgi:hypothetical protein